MKLYYLQYGQNQALTDQVNEYLEHHPFGAVPLLVDDVVGSSSSRGNTEDVPVDWINKCLTSVVATQGSALYDKTTIQAPLPDDTSKVEGKHDEDEFIMQEQSGEDNLLKSLPDMPVFVVPGAPVLMATPKKDNPVSPPARGGTETLKQFKKRKRDEAMAVLLEVIQKAKTPNEYQHIIDKGHHTLKEFSAKHAASDAYNCIKDNLGGTISACVPVTQSCNQGRLKKVNEVPSSTKKKLNFG